MSDVSWRVMVMDDQRAMDPTHCNLWNQWRSLLLLDAKCANGSGRVGLKFREGEFLDPIFSFNDMGIPEIFDPRWFRTQRCREQTQLYIYDSSVEPILLCLSRLEFGNVTANLVLCFVHVMFEGPRWFWVKWQLN